MGNSQVLQWVQASCLDLGRHHSLVGVTFAYIPSTPFACCLCRKYHILQYEPVVNHPMLHHGVGYACSPSDVPKVEALPNLGPYDRLKQGMLCEQFFMVRHI